MPFIQVGGTVFYRRSLGGEGSGNFGHAGRPGEVGGSGEGGGGSSEIRTGIITRFAQKTDSLKVEHALVLNDNNEVVGVFKGEGKSVKIPKDAKIENSHIMHNHPSEDTPGLSPADINVAIVRNLASITATGRTGIVTLNRPTNGWPKISKDDIKSAYKLELNKYYYDAEKFRDPATGKISDKDMSQFRSKASLDCLNKLSLEVKYVKR